MKRTFILAIALVFAVSVSSPQQASQSQERKPDEATEKWIAEVAASLPADEPLRHLLEAGHRGTGIHELWMDAMRNRGVKQVLVDVRGNWYRILGFRPDKVVRVVYRTEYFRPDSQIVDESKLAELRNSEFEQKLETTGANLLR